MYYFVCNKANSLILALFCWFAYSVEPLLWFLCI